MRILLHDETIRRDASVASSAHALRQSRVPRAPPVHSPTGTAPNGHGPCGP
jgi:hypothetical protein